MGMIENKFKKAAEAADMEPGPYMAKLIEGGVTQKEIAERLGCTRQAVSRIAKKYDLEFPGCEIDLENAAQEVWGQTIEEHVADHPDKRYVDMAEELDVSLSTFKRRIKELGIARRGSSTSAA